MLGNKRKKPVERGLESIFVGYAEFSKTYRLYIKESNNFVPVQTIIESRYTIFDEGRFSSITIPQDLHQNDLKDIDQNNQSSLQDDHVIIEDEEENAPILRRSKEQSKEKSFGPNFEVYLIEGTRDDLCTSIPYLYGVEGDPLTYSDAMTSRDLNFWEEANKVEMDSIMGNNTWVLEDLPPGCKPIGCKWIFRKKMNIDGIVDKFKARLVAQGFRQKHGVDHFEPYAPVARITTIRLLVAIASSYNLVIHQINVKMTFLYGDLEEEIYMRQPKGLIMKGQEKKCVQSSEVSL